MIFQRSALHFKILFPFYYSLIFTETETAVASYYHFDAMSRSLIALYNDIDDSVLTFAYSDSGSLVRVTSSEGYELSVLYNNADLVDSITLKKQGQDVNFGHVRTLGSYQGFCTKSIPCYVLACKHK